MESYFAAREMAKSGKPTGMEWGGVPQEYQAQQTAPPGTPGAFGGYGTEFRWAGEGARNPQKTQYNLPPGVAGMTGWDALNRKREAALLKRKQEREKEAEAAGGSAAPTLQAAKRARAGKEKRTDKRRATIGAVVRLKPGVKWDKTGCLNPDDFDCDIGTVVRDIWKERGVPEYIVKNAKGQSLYHENQLVVVEHATGSARGGAAAESSDSDGPPDAHPVPTPGGRAPRRGGAGGGRQKPAAAPPPPPPPSGGGVMEMIEKRAAKMREREERLKRKQTAAVRAVAGPAGDSGADDDVEA